MAQIVAKTILVRFAKGSPPVEPVNAPLEYSDPIIPGVSIPYNDEMPGMRPGTVRSGTHLPLRLPPPLRHGNK
eukprot:2184770-Pyramimonas_sp.AAC.1